MFLFYSDDILSNVITLTLDEHLHCSKVLRKNIDDIIDITDGKGNIYSCKIIAIQKHSTKCEIQSITIKNIPEPKIGIAIAPTKNASRIEWFVEKAIEIGISDIYFIHTDRTEKKAINLQRIEKIAISAMKQSMNVYLPNIQSFKNLKEFNLAIPSFYKQKFIAHCDGTTKLLYETMDKTKSALLMIGPEGDFTKDEIISAQKVDFQSVSLGSSRLRTETAGLVGLMMMKY